MATNRYIKTAGKAFQPRNGLEQVARSMALQAGKINEDRKRNRATITSGGSGGFQPDGMPDNLLGDWYRVELHLRRDKADELGLTAYRDYLQGLIDAL